MEASWVALGGAGRVGSKLGSVWLCWMGSSCIGSGRVELVLFCRLRAWGSGGEKAAERLVLHPKGRRFGLGRVGSDRVALLCWLGAGGGRRGGGGGGRGVKWSRGGEGVLPQHRADWSDGYLYSTLVGDSSLFFVILYSS